jgi:hypothetical protein
LRYYLHGKEIAMFYDKTEELREPIEQTAKRLVKRMGWTGAMRYARYQEDVTMTAKWGRISNYLGDMCGKPGTESWSTKK